MSNATTAPSKEKLDELMVALEVLNKKRTDHETAKQLTVVREGNKIILPKSLSYDAAIACLQKKIEEDETKVAIFEEIDTHPFDGAYAMMEVLKERYGWPTAQPTPGFFGPKPPVLKDIDIGYKKKAQIIWGSFAVPGIDGKLQTVWHENESGRPIFVLGGEVKQKHRDEVKFIADSIRQFISEKSVYKGQAIMLKTDEDGDFDKEVPPQFFLDITRVNENELTFSETVATQVRVNLFTPIEKTAECRKAKIPLKRGILLEGPYGTGKTLTAYVVAKKCVENRWTFVYLDRVTAIKEALSFARQYAPAVVFSEDIDRAMDGERDMSVDDILNTIDGVDSKNSELITILTTNYVDKIEKAMLRPGRLDAIISVQPPDKKAAERLMRIYGAGLIAEKEDLSQASEELVGQIPAVIREVIERAKLYALSRLKPAETLALSGSDIHGSALSMKHHLSLMTPKTRTKTTEQEFGEAFQALVGEGLNGMRKHVKEIHQRVEANLG